MLVGRFKYRLEIQENDYVDDAEGNAVEDWRTVRTVWGDIVPVSGREYLSANRDTAEITCKIYLRYLKNLTPRHRIVMKDHVYDIQSVIPDIANGFCTVMAREEF